MAEPLKAWKFTAGVIDEHGELQDLPLVAVSGLCLARTAGVLVLTRGVIPGQTEFLKWRSKPVLRDMDIAVDDSLVFHVFAASPQSLTYCELHKGGRSDHILLEVLKVSYTAIRPEFI